MSPNNQVADFGCWSSPSNSALGSHPLTVHYIPHICWFLFCQPSFSLHPLTDRLPHSRCVLSTNTITITRSPWRSCISLACHRTNLTPSRSPTTPLVSPSGTHSVSKPSSSALSSPSSQSFETSNSVFPIFHHPDGNLIQRPGAGAGRREKQSGLHIWPETNVEKPIDQTACMSKPQELVRAIGLTFVPPLSKT